METKQLLEDPEFTRLRVKLFKTGKFSHDQITKIFETLSSPDDLHNMGLITKKCEELVLLPEYAQYRGLIDEMCRFMVANEGMTVCKVIAEKRGRNWKFTVS